MSRLVRIWNLGRLSYANSLEVQKYLAGQHVQNEEEPHTLLLVEHNPVYTTGIRTKVYNQEEESRLKTLGADFFRTNRGGLITYHGPGQLVAYPILNLKKFNPSTKWYVCHIEKAIIDLCSKLKLEAYTSPHTGVWINDNKVCAIGVHCSKFITTHGLALNCTMDVLKWFNHIVACGIQDKGVTSLSKELGRDISVEESTALFLDSFSKIFNCEYIDYPKEQTDLISKSISENIALSQ